MILATDPTKCNSVIIVSGRASHGTTKRVRGVPNWVVRTHERPAVWAFGGTPYGATKRVRDVRRNKYCGRMWTLPLGPS
eukprot:2925380-Pyramimonas_sp.AAC.1